MEEKTTDHIEKEAIIDLVEGEDLGEFVGIHAVHRNILVDMLLDGDRDLKCPVLKIGMPCGKEYIFEKREEVPLKTLMCGCGNPKHVVVKYSMEDD